jgi:undecaprenyl-diphosphatase
VPLGIDEQLFPLLYAGSDHPALTASALFFSAIGGGWGMVALVPLAALPRTRRFAAWLLAVLAVNAVVVFAVKAAVGRGRPFTVYTGAERILLDSPTDASFPSGHAAGSFAFALFTARVLLAARPRPPFAGITAAALVVLASSVAVSRVVLGFHFPLDVLAGAALGAAIGAVAGSQFNRTAAL